MDLHVENILSLIPQRPPFVMVDHLISSDEKGGTTGFLVSENNILVVDGRLSEPGLVENIAQTAAARAGSHALKENKPVQVGYIGAVSNLIISSLPKVGDFLETEVAIKNQIFDVTIITGTVRCNNVVIAQCEMKIFLMPHPENMQ